MKIKNLIPVFTASIMYARCSSGFNSGSGQPLKGSDIRLLHNLMHALAAKVVRICNFTKRKAIAAHLNNLRISIVVSCRSWLKWTPSPTWQLLQRFGFFGRKLTLLVPLTHVANPSPEINLTTVHNLNMNCGGAGVTRTLGELVQCSDIKFESGVVIHGVTI